MRCEELLRHLSDYIDGELDPALCRELERHMDGCDPCQVVIDTLEKTVTLYRGETEHELPEGFRRRLHDHLAERWRSRTGDAEGP